MSDLRDEALHLWQETWKAFAHELGNVDTHPVDRQISEAAQQIDDAIKKGHGQEYILQAAHDAGATFRTDLDYYLPRR